MQFPVFLFCNKQRRWFVYQLSNRGSTKRPQPDMHYLHTEMRRKGVTLLLLWNEYKQAHSDGYEYSQFCEHYRRSKQKLGLVLRQEHRAGEKMFTDWAGQTVPIVNRYTGEITFASIFVAVLGARPPAGNSGTSGRDNSEQVADSTGTSTRAERASAAARC